MTKEITKKYTNGEVTIVWKPSLCIHSGNCFTGLPEVFRPREKPWITPEHATTEEIITQVKHCPSGALSYYLNSDEEVKNVPAEPAETSLPETRVEVKPGGPLRVHGKLRVELPNGEVVYKETAASFCRCGHSKNKPFCDSSHKDAGFSG